MVLLPELLEFPELLLFPELLELPELDSGLELPKPLLPPKRLFELLEDLLELLEPFRLVAPLRSLWLPPRMETLARSSSTMGS